jgi:pyruvate dehydrogenase E1 component alpha subunit
MEAGESFEPAFLKKLLREMLLIRRFEEKAGQLYGLRKIGGFCHLYIGQEAVCTGALAAIDLQKDYLLTAYRDHGYALSAGMKPGVVMAELFGKATGCSRGKGGSMHLFDVGRHFLGGHGIVGAHLPLATGVGFKIRYNEEDGVVLCFFGEGSIHQGTFHESLNMARIWNLPVVYICENNQYGMGTDFRRVSAVHDFSILATSYDMPGKQVDGMDVLSVYRETKQAAERARKEKMPSLLEMITYRFVGHSMSDPATYRTKDELAEHKRQDPIVLFQEKLLKESVVTEAELGQMEQNCRAEVEEAVRFAEESADPAIETLYEDVLI